MKVLVDRDSVCAGDDIESHERLIEVADDLPLESVLANVIAAYGMPLVGGGKATWCAQSKRPLAVIATEWPAPKMLSWPPLMVADCEVVDGVLRLHFTYLAQHNPEVAFEVLRRVYHRG